MGLWLLCTTHGIRELSMETRVDFSDADISEPANSAGGGGDGCGEGGGGGEGEGEGGGEGGVDGGAIGEGGGDDGSMNSQLVRSS